MLKDYFGMSEVVNGIELFPIKVVEWERFSEISIKYLSYGYDFIKYKLKPDKEVVPFDILVSLMATDILQVGDMECKTVHELEEMFSMVVHKDVKLEILRETDNWSFVFEGGSINRSNYDEIRKVIMRQNLIFEPLLVDDPYTQKIIDRAMKTKNKQGGDFDFQSMIVFVSTKRNLSPHALSEYTYYQLRCDNEMIHRNDMNDSIHVYRSQGAKVDPMNVYKRLETLDNPYSWDKFFTKVDGKQDSQMQGVMKG